MRVPFGARVTLPSSPVCDCQTPRAGLTKVDTSGFGLPPIVPELPPSPFLANVRFVGHGLDTGSDSSSPAPV